MAPNKTKQNTIHLRLRAKTRQAKPEKRMISFSFSFVVKKSRFGSKTNKKKEEKKRKTANDAAILARPPAPFFTSARYRFSLRYTHRFTHSFLFFYFLFFAFREIIHWSRSDRWLRLASTSALPSFSIGCWCIIVSFRFFWTGSRSLLEAVYRVSECGWNPFPRPNDSFEFRGIRYGWRDELWFTRSDCFTFSWVLWSEVASLDEGHRKNSVKPGNTLYNSVTHDKTR